MFWNRTPSRSWLTAVATASATSGCRSRRWRNPRRCSAGNTCTPTSSRWGAAYLFHLVKNHPFLDGNKRVGLETALLFLEINGQSIETTDDALVDLVLQTAQGQIDKQHIAEFFRAHAAEI